MGHRGISSLEGGVRGQCPSSGMDEKVRMHVEYTEKESSVPELTPIVLRKVLCQRGCITLNTKYTDFFFEL